MNPEGQQQQNPEFAKMSIKAGVEGEGKPMVIKKEPKPEIRGRVLPIHERKKPKRVTGDSIF